MKYSLFLVLLMAQSTGFSYTEITEAGAPPSLHRQYNSLKADIEVVDGYRMMKVYLMDQFWKSVQDSMQVQQQSLKESVALMAAQSEEINMLKSALTESQMEKEGLVLGVDSIIVLGNPYSKAGFISVVSFVILGLVVLAVLLFSVGRVSMVTTRELRKLNESIYQEFEGYKHKAVEKQIKISRELQDYRNRVAELKSA